MGLFKSILHINRALKKTIEIYLISEIEGEH